MNITVYDSTISKIGFLESVFSYILPFKRGSADEFSIWVAATESNIQMAAQGTFIRVPVANITNSLRNFVLGGSVESPTYKVSSEAPRALHGRTGCLQADYNLNGGSLISGTCELQLVYTTFSGVQGVITIDILGEASQDSGTAQVSFELPEDLSGFNDIILTKAVTSDITVTNVMLSCRASAQKFQPAPEDTMQIQPIQDFSGIITGFSLQQNEEFNGILITGKSLQDVLRKRCVWGMYQKRGTVYDIFQDLVDVNFINPSNPNRQIDILYLDNSFGDGESFPYQKTGGYVSDATEALLSDTAYGVQAILDTHLKRIRLYLYKGKVLPITFSDSNGMLVSPVFTRDTTNQKNVALVAGEGEGRERTYTCVGEGAVGWGREELFVDARDLQSTSETGEVLSKEEYLATLQQRGSEKLASNTAVDSFESSISLQGYLPFIDFNPGDLVISKHSLGISIERRIEAITLSNSGGQEEVSVKFGQGRLTLAEMLKAKFR